MVIKKILVIGFGRMGVSYVSSFLNFFYDVEIFIFDRDLKNAKKKLSLLDLGKNRITLFESVDDIVSCSEKFDLYINSTQVLGRWGYENYLVNHQIPKRIYEKPLFSRNFSAEINGLTEAILNNSYVNFSRRLSPELNTLKRKHQGQIQKLIVRGKNLNLGSNWSHFLDLFCWLSDSGLDDIRFTVDRVHGSGQYSILEGSCRGSINGEDRVIVTSRFRPFAEKNYSSSIILCNGTEIPFREVFGAVSFGASDGLAVNVPLARDFDFGRMLNLDALDSNTEVMRLPLISEVLPVIYRGTRALYASLDKSGFDSVEVT